MWPELYRPFLRCAALPSEPVGCVQSLPVLVVTVEMMTSVTSSTCEMVRLVESYVVLAMNLRGRFGLFGGDGLPACEGSLRANIRNSEQVLYAPSLAAVNGAVEL